MGCLTIALILFTSWDCLLKTNGAKRQLVVDWTRTEFNVRDPKMVSEAESWIVRRPKTTALFNARLGVLQDVTNVTVKVRVSINRNGKYTEYLKMELDGCEALQQYYTNFLLELAIREIRRVGNLPLTCPFTKQNYYVTNFTLEPNLFPLFLPNLDWTVVAGFFFYGKLSSELSIWGTLRKS